MKNLIALSLLALTLLGLGTALHAQARSASPDDESSLSKNRRDGGEEDEEDLRLALR